MKKILFVVVLVLSATVLFPEGKVKKRLFYFGLGPGFVINLLYSSELLNSELERIETIGAARTIGYGGISIGVAVSDKSYLLFSKFIYLDDLEQAGWHFTTDCAHVETSFSVIGVRHYPFTTGIVLGGDIGVAVQEIEGTAYLDGERYSGIGCDLLVAFDFDNTITGFTIQLGLKVSGYIIGAGSFRAAGVFCTLVFK